jgi:hypothetical protein
MLITLIEKSKSKSNTTCAQVRIYEVQPSGNTVPKTAYSHEAPALCVSWSKVNINHHDTRLYIN